MLSEIGRIGRDAELRHLPNGTPVCNIALAYNYGRKGEDGQRPTQWIEIAVWGNQATGLQPYLTKGKQIKVDVRDVRVDQYQHRDGHMVPKLVGDLAGIKFVSDGSGSQNQNQATQQQYQQPQPRNASQPQPAQQQPVYDDFGDSEIPF